ncbi:MAG: restriction endonuclease subunit S [Proteobacteria bacterium]|nr:restriction endonuclease subunit S [Pseudomonadota bacterium]
MIRNLKPYSEYKDSGQKWLGRVPIHWSLLPNRALFDEVKDQNHPEEEMLSVTIGRGIIKQRELLAGTSKKDSSNTNKSKYKLVRPGELAYNKMRAWQGALGASELRGIISPAYIVVRPRHAVNPWYFHHLYRTPGFAKEAERWSYGISSDMWSLRPEHFKVIGAILPPPDEQSDIVNFLGHANQKIDSFIRAKRRLIGLLNEQKQSIVQRAVTRGLDPNVKLKSSGVKWLGDIPEHWDIRRAKNVFKEIDERSKTGREEMLSVSHLTGVTPRSEKNITMFKAESNVGHKICRPGDLAINTMWAWMAALGFSKHEGVISPAYAVYRQREPKRLVDDYGDLLLRTEPYKANYITRSTGIRASRLRLYPKEFFKIPIVIPPKDEQREIVDFVNNETAIPTAAIDRANREIALMQEYSARLTSDIVTGKLDVRAAAAQLPELPTPEALIAGADGLGDELGDEFDMEEVDE